MSDPRPVKLLQPSLPGLPEAGFFFDTLDECVEWLKKISEVNSEHLVRCHGKMYRVNVRNGGVDIASVQTFLFPLG